MPSDSMVIDLTKDAEDLPSDAKAKPCCVIHNSFNNTIALYKNTEGFLCVPFMDCFSEYETSEETIMMKNMKGQDVQFRVRYCRNKWENIDSIENKIKQEFMKCNMQNERTGTVKIRWTAVETILFKGCIN